MFCNHAKLKTFSSTEKKKHQYFDITEDDTSITQSPKARIVKKKSFEIPHKYLLLKIITHPFLYSFNNNVLIGGSRDA